MPYLFKDYCYADITKAAKAEISQPLTTNANSSMYLQSFETTSSPDKVTFIISVKDYLNNTLTDYSLNRTYPECTIEGPFVTDTMMTPTDATDLSWAVIGCFALAFCIKLLRRTL